MRYAAVLSHISQAVTVSKEEERSGEKENFIIVTFQASISRLEFRSENWKFNDGEKRES